MFRREHKDVKVFHGVSVYTVCEKPAMRNIGTQLFLSVWVCSGYPTAS